MMKQIIFILLLFKFILPTYGQDNREMKLLRWTEDQANNWYAELPWLIGADYINADAINQIEMWSKNTCNHNEINNELGMAESLGFNTLRVYLSSMVY